MVLSQVCFTEAKVVCGEGLRTVDCTETEYCSAYIKAEEFRPLCVEYCTLADCSGNADHVEYFPPSDCRIPYMVESWNCPNPVSKADCKCTCKPGHTGTKCESCIPEYKLEGASCVPRCTLASSCNGKGVSVSWVSGDKCKCTCENKWTGDACETCPSPYGEAACNECLAGHIGFPDCTQCTSDAHCNGHASSVTDDGLRSTCACECATPWTGATCSACPAQYRGAKCDACASGHVLYPTCTKCSVAEHCSGHAKSVASNAGNTQCVCACSDGYAGDTCNKCAAGYVGYPACRACDAVQDCSGHASEVATNAEQTACTCDVCLAQWTGDTCGTCPPRFETPACSTCVAGHVDYPNCRECTIPNDCSGHASAVTDEGRAICKCTCLDHWEGDACDVCPRKYDQVSCKKCAAGRINFPACDLCTAQEHCNGHASSVTSDATSTSCVCTCETEYTGSSCDTCAEGGIDYPSCEQCTAANACSGHATGVAASADQTQCICDCKDKWEGNACDTCAPKYDSVSCAGCAAGYITYPTCTQCTDAAHCNGHSSRVSDDGTRKSCTCTCKTGYTGATCDACHVGYVGYPNCRLCTVSADCSGNADAVTDDGTRSQCVCTCKNKWSDSNCATCPSVYEGAGCDTCVEGRVSYPTCTECDVATDCSGHASAVTDDGNRASCKCSCSNQWTGLSCETCPTHYTGAQCDGCATGRINYPTCLQCTSASHCSGRADAVSNTPTSCVCDCTNKWSGDACETCPVMYDPEMNCANCAEGYIQPYPACTKCDVDVHCSSHAINVTDDGKRSSCVCNCKEQWSGANCETCPPLYTGANCDECAAGAVGYPACGPCTLEDSCSGDTHASAVVSNVGNTECVCLCKNKWEGSNCEICPSIYSGSDCNKCEVGHITFPSCTACSIATHCSGHAKSVTDDGTNSKCVCTCMDGYSGDTCDTCTDGFVGYPCRACTVDDDCNSHADSVEADIFHTTCTCHCSGQWLGDTCTTCPSHFEGQACDRCVEGRVTYPLCRECTTDLDCSGHATAVVEVARETCACTCANQWTGDKCETCPTKYRGADCNICALGSINYPECTVCTTAMCSDRAPTPLTDTDQTVCTCQCNDMWDLPICDTCAPKYDSVSCAGCAAGYITYPTCTQCTDAAHCNGHSSRVSDDGTRKSCTCTCKTGYTGATCDACHVGYVGYPNCRLCTVSADCSGNADAVTDDGTRSQCVCTCKNKWSDSNCATCPSVYDKALDCGNCAEGRVDFAGVPSCSLCTNAVHCNDHAVSVKDDGTRSTCECSCSNQWTGLQCETCPSKYSGNACDTCAVGRIDYPRCTACVSVTHCSNHAASVTSDASMTTCTCTCRNEWKGLTCDECDAKFENDCAECAAGHIKPFPACIKCDIATHCSGNADTVTDDGSRDSCRCACRNQWTGANCQTCPPQFGGSDCNECASGKIGYPICSECTIETSCSNHANSVATDGSKTSCVCSCQDQWGGDACEVCPDQYTQSTCSSCDVGRVNYPTCTQCTSEAHCNDNAAFVTDATRTTCVCTCHVGYEGPTCGMCAEGYTGYPFCSPCSLISDCSGHATAVTSDASREKCVCTCGNSWAGDNCESCPSPFGEFMCDQCSREYEGLPSCGTCNAGYVNFPTCTACTSTEHCNGHATGTNDDGTRTSCLCTCKANYVGATCDACAVGHYNYPDCDQCTNEDHCNDHALSATDDGTRTGCTCHCANQWTGNQCEVCPVAFEGLECNKCAVSHINYPTCTQCDMSLHCSGHAVAVTDDGVRSECKCTCRNQWVGETCDVCPSVFAGADCDACPALHINYPTCTACSNATACNKHADSMHTNAAGDACECVCQSPWDGLACEICPSHLSGANCDKCADGRIGYPTCTECTSKDHCNDHAKRVTDDGTHTTCKCTCAATFEGTTCDSCVEGYVGYPSCRECDVLQDCSGHAGAVTDDARKTCTCQCRNKWEGAKCETCPAMYGGSDCNACAAGRILYPTCTECTVAAHCTNHADSVAADQNECKCTCRNQWSGAACDTCAAHFGGADCDKCKVGHVNYPTCTECTNPNHCSNHAASVTSDASMTTCACTCRNEWKGLTCDECDAKFENDCAECAAGHVKPFPACIKCDTRTHCSGNADSVTDDGSRDSCRCACRNQWSGANCQTCPPQFGGSDCNECASGKIGYPACGGCTVDGSCSGHAVSVATDATQTKCVCTCRNQWSGDRCDVCESHYSGADCDACASGHIGYDTCAPCTPVDHCSGHATSVTDDGSRAKCVCDCENQWVGDTCETCPAEYEGDKCNRCAGGRINYPQCTLCTQAACTGHATSVTDDGTRTTCMCSCSNQWTGSACDVCPSPFDGADCDMCLDGRINYPTCTECTAFVHCNDRATSVTDLMATSCVCTCRNKWTGDQCQTCASPYDGQDCDKCEPGTVGFPTCTECSNATHCNGRALQVSDDGTRTTCACTCMNAWTGDQCETCPGEFGGANCDMCAVGFIGSVATGCTECSNQVHCNGRAAPLKNDASKTPNVTDDGTRSTCVCSCSNQWVGDRCETCPTIFGGDACDTCAAGRINYPTCELCDMKQHCSGHAASVSVDILTDECACVCDASWEGTACETCPSKYVQSTCDKCADGFINYPTCSECSLDTHCNGHASAVVSNVLGETCVCTCKNQWTGDSCSVCDSTVYGGTDCDQCATGFINYPFCGDACVINLNCSGNADKVEFMPATASCACSCKNKWSGASCDTCDPIFDQVSCDACAADHILFPVCDLCTNATCSGNAVSVRADALQTKCLCNCMNHWTGDTCDTCAAGMDATCSTCLPGWSGVAPTCTQCSNADHCSNHALSVDATSTACVCTCKNKWEGTSCDICPSLYGGADCDTCAPSLMNFPVCEPSCELSRNCSANAVMLWEPPNICTCECTNHWTGTQCETCDPKYENTTCNACAEGHINYPECHQCTVADSCNTHASEVMDDGTRSTCICNCTNHWTGPSCAICPVPFGGQNCDECGPARIGYPTCSQCTEEGDCSGHATSVTSDFRQEKCLCTCRNQWSGANCSVCPELYDGPDCDRCSANRADYPTCGMACSVAANCSGNALQVDYIGKTCACSCSNRWTGLLCDQCLPPFGGANCDVCEAGNIMTSVAGITMCEPCSLVCPTLHPPLSLPPTHPPTYSHSADSMH